VIDVAHGPIMVARPRAVRSSVELARAR
jgi:hypothetical protein